MGTEWWDGITADSADKASNQGFELTSGVLNSSPESQGVKSKRNTTNKSTDVYIDLATLQGKKGGISTLKKRKAEIDLQRKQTGTNKTGLSNLNPTGSTGSTTLTGVVLG